MSRTNSTEKLETGGELPLRVILSGFEAWVAYCALNDLGRTADFPLAKAEHELKDKLRPVAERYVNNHVNVRRVRPRT